MFVHIVLYGCKFNSGLRMWGIYDSKDAKKKNLNHHFTQTGGLPEVFLEGITWSVSAGVQFCQPDQHLHRFFHGFYGDKFVLAVGVVPPGEQIGGGQPHVG
jgi:hypothetical protein